MTRLRPALVALAALPALAVLGPVPHADAALDRSSSDTSSSDSRVEVRRELYTVTGRVVRFGNGRPVRGVRVTLYEGARGFLAADTTDANGRFAVRFSAPDDGFGVYLQGNRVGMQNGWVGCDLTVKRTFGAACVHGTSVAPIRIKQV